SSTSRTAGAWTRSATTISSARERPTASAVHRRVRRPCQPPARAPCRLWSDARAWTAGAARMMTIAQATVSYERWLGRFMRLGTRDLRRKHGEMAEARLPFLRATFYRWCQLWLAHAGKARRASAVLAIGDLHVENFGTWRDVEGRLVWGANDFDEVARMP